jgi:uncharacterized protein YkwD
MRFRGSVLLGVTLALGACDGELEDADTDAMGEASGGGGEAGDESGGNSDGNTSTSGGGGGTGVPSNAYCDPVASWDTAMVEFEEDVLVLVNEARAAGATCGSQSFGAASPLTMNPALRCAARVHSKDMSDRSFFDHTNPDGEDPFVRMDRAGYSYFTAGENIAAGQSSPQEVMAGWMDSPGHCSNIMNPDFTEIGVGTFEGPGQFRFLWTQTFGG